MPDPSWTEVWTAYGTVATAVLTPFLIAVAGLALRDWKMALKNQRADECVSAIRDLSGALGRCISLKKAKSKPDWNPTQTMWLAHGQMWDAWRRFDRAFFVACRYHEKLDPKLTEQIKHELYALEPLLHDKGDPQIEEVQEKVEKLLKIPLNLFVGPRC